MVSRRSSGDPWRYGVQPSPGDRWFLAASWSQEVEEAGGTAWEEGSTGREWTITR